MRESHRIRSALPLSLLQSKRSLQEGRRALSRARELPDRMLHGPVQQLGADGGRRSAMRYWTVFPEDPDLMPQDFETYSEAKDYADGLCCSYTIEQAQ